MPSTETLRNIIYITTILYFHLELMPKSFSLKSLGLKLIKLKCIILKRDLDKIKVEISYYN